MRVTSLRRPALVLGCAAGLGLAAGVALAQFGGGGRAKGDAKAPPLPEGLRQVPLDAVAFVHVRVQDLAKGEVGQALLKRLGQDPYAGKVMKDIEAAVGVKLADLESVTIVLPDPAAPVGPRRSPGITPDKRLDLDGRLLPPDDEPGPLLILTAAQPLDRKAILRAFGPGAAQRLPHNTSVLFLSERSMIVGRSAELFRYSARGGAAETAFGSPRGVTLRSALVLAAEGHLVTAGAHLPADARARLLRDLRHEQLGALGVLLPLVLAEATVTVDFADGAADVRVRFASLAERDFALVREAAKSLPTVLELALDGDPAIPLPARPEGEVRKRLRKAVARATVDTLGQMPGQLQVEMRLRVDVDADLLMGLLSKLRQAGNRSEGANQRKQIEVVPPP